MYHDNTMESWTWYHSILVSTTKIPLTVLDAAELVFGRWGINVFILRLFIQYIHTLLASSCTRDLSRTESFRQSLPRLPDELTLLSKTSTLLRVRPANRTPPWVRWAWRTPGATQIPSDPQVGPTAQTQPDSDSNGSVGTAWFWFSFYIWSGLWRTAGPARAQSSPVRQYVTPCLDFISHFWQIAQSTAITARERMIVLQVKCAVWLCTALMWWTQLSRNPVSCYIQDELLIQMKMIIKHISVLTTISAFNRGPVYQLWQMCSNSTGRIFYQGMRAKKKKLIYLYFPLILMLT